MKRQLEKFKIDFNDPRYTGIPKSRIKKLAKQEYWERNKTAYKKLKKEQKKIKHAQDPKPQPNLAPQDPEDMNKPNRKEIMRQIRERQASAPVILIDIAFEDKSDEKVT